MMNLVDDFCHGVHHYLYNYRYHSYHLVVVGSEDHCHMYQYDDHFDDDDGDDDYLMNQSVVSCHLVCERLVRSPGQLSRRVAYTMLPQVHLNVIDERHVHHDGSMCQDDDDAMMTTMMMWLWMVKPYDVWVHVPYSYPYDCLMVNLYQ